MLDLRRLPPSSRTTTIALLVAVFSLGLLGCSDRTMPTTTSAADRTDTGLNEESLDELELLADQAVALPAGGVWLPRSGSVVRPEVWLPALGLVEWSDPGVVATQEFEEVLAGPEVQRSSGLGPVAVLGADAVGGPSLVQVAAGRTTAHLDESASVLLRLRSDALGRAAGSYAAECATALAQLRSGLFDFNVTATLILTRKESCQGDALARAWCDTATLDAGLADRLLDIAALERDGGDTLAKCANDVLTEVLSRIGDEIAGVEEGIQYLGVLAWTARRGGEARPGSIEASFLLSEAARVVDEGGMAVFASDTTDVTFDDFLILRSLSALQLLEVDLDELTLVGSNPSAVAEHPLREPAPGFRCTSTSEQSIAIDPVTAGSPLEVSTAAMLDSLEPCATPVVELPADPTAARFMELAVVVVGCHNAGMPGQATGTSSGEVPEEFVSDRLLRFIDAITESNEELSCRAVTSR